MASPTTSRHRRRVEDGKPFWAHRPFGFEKDGRHRKCEADAIRRAYADLLAGASLRSIAKNWNEEGVLTSRGGQWHPVVLRTMLLHPRNAGIHTYTPRERQLPHQNWSRTPPQPSGNAATWPAIVSIESWEALCRLLADPSRSTHGGGLRKGLLTGIALCSLCGTGMTQAWKPKRVDGTRLRKYTCRRCHGASIDADWLDEYIIRQLVRGLVHSARDQQPSQAELMGVLNSWLELRSAPECHESLRKLISAQLAIKVLPRAKGERVSGPKDVEIVFRRSCEHRWSGDTDPAVQHAMSAPNRLS